MTWVVKSGGSETKPLATLSILALFDKAVKIGKVFWDAYNQAGWLIL